MKYLAILSTLLAIVVISGCDTHKNFMDVDNPNATVDLHSMIWTWITDWFSWWLINSGDIWKLIPDSVKWYAKQYYNDTMKKYVDKSKSELSGKVQALKIYYNSWVDKLSDQISDRMTNVISDRLNKLKL